MWAALSITWVRNIGKGMRSWPGKLEAASLGLPSASLELWQYGAVQRESSTAPHGR